jgi:FMN-dependent NADH-azoreductase
MRRILEDVWQLDVRTVEAEFTLVGVNPALDEFRDLAAQMRKDAEATARSHGQALASHPSIGAEVHDQGNR